MTPTRTAQFMAGLFPPCSNTVCRLLDPGAGIGSLSSAFIERWFLGNFGFKSLLITAFEIDAQLRAELERTISSYEGKASIAKEIVSEDFIEEAVNRIQFRYGGEFTHAILNPPYRKINSHSRHRRLLRQVGIETVNLYSAFVALTLALMASAGNIVAILPRSFCNGPYYRPFRDFIIDHAAIRHLHLFDSRNTAFKDDGVLQENVIILLECSGQQGDVTVSTSTDDGFTDLSSHVYPFDQIVFPGDPERFIHVPTSPNHNLNELSSIIRYSLDEIGIKVSTGPVVDFRLREHIRTMPEPGTVPLLYPCHFGEQLMKWPKEGMKKPNAIHWNTATQKWLFPNGFYCVVRRLSSKEEKRRIVASVVDPSTVQNASMLGFENHLNVFHESKHGLPEALARGLAVFLNATVVDEQFRRFNGHTQVNATDLKRMKYPSRKALIELGEWAMRYSELSRTMIDERLATLTA